MLGRMPVDALLQSIPPLLVYLLVGGVIGIESLGIPLPGEVMLVGAALLSSRPDLAIDPAGVAAAAIIGAVIGDSIGYSIGRRFGMPLFDRMGARFPKHFGPGHVAYAEDLFVRWGAATVFFGRFIALLRILAGPLAGALKMRYPQFLVANVTGAICWAGGTTALVYYAGMAAEHWPSGLPASHVSGISASGTAAPSRVGPTPASPGVLCFPKLSAHSCTYQSAMSRSGSEYGMST